MKNNCKKIIRNFKIEKKNDFMWISFKLTKNKKN